MILKFLDREEEIKKVEEKYESKKSEFAVIYGRRRIGKTELIKKVIEGKRAFYFLCEKKEKEAARILDALKEKSAFVNWFNNVREEHFGLIAKKIDEEVKEKLRSEGYLVFDIAGIKNQEISRD